MATFTPQESEIKKITSSILTTIIPSPSSGEKRMVNLVSVYNRSEAVTESFYLQLATGGTAFIMELIDLPPICTYRYEGSPSIILGATQTLEIQPTSTPTEGLDIFSSFGDFN
jgi:hypothetical protein